MDTLDKYGFQNPLELIGIDNIYDIDGLRKKVDSLIVQIKNLLYEKNKPFIEKKNQELEYLKNMRSNLTTDEELRECEDRIKIIESNLKGVKKGREKWYQDFDKIATEVHSTNNPAIIIYQIIKLSDSYIRSLPVSNRNNMVDPNFKRVVHDLDSAFRNPSDVNRFLIDKAYIMQNINFKEANLSRYEYFGGETDKNGYPIYICGARPEEEPVLKLDTISDTGDRVQVFKIGQYAFGKFVNLRGKSTQSYGDFDILTVLRKSENGDLRRYNGIIYFKRPIDYSNKRFFTNTVFSDLVMQNAEKNNFGYIGKLETEKGFLELSFNDKVGVQETIASLSYNQKFGKGRFLGMPECQTLSQFYDIMNQRVMEITNLGEHPSSQPRNDEGGR